MARVSQLILFHTIMWALVLPPLFATVALMSVSALTYDTLRDPAKHESSSRIWIQIAQAIYYFYEANIWQSKRNCVRYDEELLYVPSSGCAFSNLEYTTKLSFSDDGRKIDTNSTKHGPAILLLGDSLAMGWGVNDDETYSYLIGLKNGSSHFQLSCVELRHRERTAAGEKAPSIQQRKMHSHSLQQK